MVGDPGERGAAHGEVGVLVVAGHHGLGVADRSTGRR
jgi:hypothetical protein